MSDRLYGVADVGGTQERTAVFDDDMRMLDLIIGSVNTADYEGSVRGLAANIHRIARAAGGELVAVTVGVASELDDDGCLRLGGALSKWDGRQIGVDVGAELGLPAERSGALNDMEAVAESQLAVNEAQGVEEDGAVDTLSSGWGGKPYGKDRKVGYDSPGHEHLRDGAKCPCGGVGHTEAHLSGNGIKLNHGVSAKEWLRDGTNAEQFVTDLSTALVAMITRRREEGYPMDVSRWMGGVHNGQPVLVERAWARVREALRARGQTPPVREAVTLGSDMAGLHGAYVNALRLAKAA